MQNEDPSAHVPFLHRPEQQPPAPPAGAVQGFPAVRQVVLSAWHFPPVQVPLQQLDEPVQVAPSATQVAALAQRWLALSHCRLQQSVFTAQELPGAPQVLSREVQVSEVASHTCVQHCAFDVQATPTTLQAPPPPAPVWLPPVPVWLPPVPVWLPPVPVWLPPVPVWLPPVPVWLPPVPVWPLPAAPAVPCDPAEP